MIKVLFFAGVKEQIGQDFIELDDRGWTVGQLKHHLLEKYPQASESLANVMVSVNEEFADDGTKLHENDQVAIIPPVCGG